MVSLLQSAADSVIKLIGKSSGNLLAQCGFKQSKFLHLSWCAPLNLNNDLQ
ncbi:hypothetical protein FDUTEX481_03701 [Tolypothrix sp. PCC 7601]|nr:hypothetical protein FDUTEX481_03701 [Tolypothrix sp. PCC 7601]